MKKCIKDNGREIWEEVELTDSFDQSMFYEVDMSTLPDDYQFALHTNLGSITVLDRLTGFSGYVRDVETGFRDPEGNFWLASGNFDVRSHTPKVFEDATILIKKNANTCVPNVSVGSGK